LLVTLNAITTVGRKAGHRSRHIRPAGATSALILLAEVPACFAKKAMERKSLFQGLAAASGMEDAHAVGALSATSHVMVLMANTCSVLANNSACNQPGKVSVRTERGAAVKGLEAPTNSLFSTTQGAVMRSIVNVDEYGQVENAR